MPDNDIDDNNSKHHIIVDSVGQYMLIMREMTADSHTNLNSNKMTLSHGLFYCVNQIIKLCDIINNETMKNIVLSDIDQFRSRLTSFPLSDVCTHLYYLGRYHFQKGGNDLFKAREHLEYAYKLCLNSSLNKTRILLLLIPIKMIFGYLPNLNKMNQSFYDRFFPIIHALKTGNILLFKKALSFYEDDFINCGIYLLMAKLELLVIRALVLQIYATKQRMEGLDQPFAVKLSEIKKGIQIRNKQYDESQFCVRFDGEKKQNKEDDIDRILVDEMDADEIECLLSTLIYKKLIGAYVAHNTAVVISKNHNKAFPPIKNCKGWWINDF